jgi:hypothetical protein
MSPLETQFSFPTLPHGIAPALADEPILIDGLKVLFDQKVALFPVTVKPKGAPGEEPGEEPDGRG